MANKPAVIVPMFDDHDGPGAPPKDKRLGHLYYGYEAVLVCLGPADYEGALSVNEVTSDKGAYHVTRDSHYALDREAMLRLNTEGRIRLDERRTLHLLSPALFNF